MKKKPVEIKYCPWCQTVMVIKEDFDICPHCGTIQYKFIKEAKKAGRDR